MPGTILKDVIKHILTNMRSSQEKEKQETKKKGLSMFSANLRQHASLSWLIIQKRIKGSFYANCQMMLLTSLLSRWYR